MATHTATVIIEAPAHKVFDALTKPERIRLWQYNRMLSTTWETGSTIKFRTETEGKVLEQWGTILALKINELIQYNLFTPGPDIEDKIENYCVTSYLLADDKGQTKVDLIQEDNRPYGFTPMSLKPILLSLKNIVEHG